MLSTEEQRERYIQLEELRSIERFDTVTKVVLESLPTKFKRGKYIEDVKNIPDDKWHTSAENTFPAVSLKPSDKSFLINTAIENWLKTNGTNISLMRRILLEIYKKHHHDQIHYLTCNDNLMISELNKILHDYHAAIYKRQIIDTVENYYQMYQIGLPVTYGSSSSLQEPRVKFVVNEMNTICFEPSIPMSETLKKAIAQIPFPKPQGLDEEPLEKQQYDSLLKKLNTHLNVALNLQLIEFDQCLKNHLNHPFANVNEVAEQEKRMLDLTRAIEEQNKIIDDMKSTRIQVSNPSWFYKYYPLSNYTRPFRLPSYIGSYIGVVMLIASLCIPIIAQPFLMSGSVILGLSLLIIACSMFIKNKLDPVIHLEIEKEKFNEDLTGKIRDQENKRGQLISQKHTIDLNLRNFAIDKKNLTTRWSIIIANINNPYHPDPNGTFASNQVNQSFTDRPRVPAGKTDQSEKSILSPEFERQLADPNSWFNQTRRKMEAEGNDPDSETSRTHRRLRAELDAELREPNSWFNQSKCK